MDNCQITFRCSKCHIFESEKIDNLRRFNLKWIKSFDNKAPPVRNLSEFYEVLDIYNELLLKKVNYIKKNIIYIQNFKINNTESKTIYYETLSNILSIFFESIQYGKNVLLLTCLIMNTIKEDVNNINKNISTKIQNDIIKKKLQKLIKVMILQSHQ